MTHLLAAFHMAVAKYLTASPLEKRVYLALFEEVVHPGGEGVALDGAGGGSVCEAACSHLPAPGRERGARFPPLLISIPSRTPSRGRV